MTEAELLLLREREYYPHIKACEEALNMLLPLFSGIPCPAPEKPSLKRLFVVDTRAEEWRATLYVEYTARLFLEESHGQYKETEVTKHCKYRFSPRGDIFPRFHPSHGLEVDGVAQKLTDKMEPQDPRKHYFAIGYGVEERVFQVDLRDYYAWLRCVM